MFHAFDVVTTEQAPDFPTWGGCGLSGHARQLCSYGDGFSNGVNHLCDLVQMVRTVLNLLLLAVHLIYQRDDARIVIMKDFVDAVPVVPPGRDVLGHDGIPLVLGLA